MEIALKEARETEYWLEILIESEVVEKGKFDSLLQETKEIVRILIASTRKIKERLNGNKLRSSKIVVARDKHSQFTTSVNSKPMPPS